MVNENICNVQKLHDSLHTGFEMALYVCQNISTTSKHILPAWQGDRTIFVDMFQILLTNFIFWYLDKNNEHTNLHALKGVDCPTMQKEW
jgi:hypothetical protein